MLSSTLLSFHTPLPSSTTLPFFSPPHPYLLSLCHRAPPLTFPLCSRAPPPSFPAPVSLRRPDLLSSPAAAAFLSFAAAAFPTLDQSKLSRLLLAADDPSHLLSRFVQTTQILTSHGFPEDRLSYLANHLDAKKLFVNTPAADLAAKIEFLKHFGWPEVAVRRPAVLNLDLRAQLEPRAEFLVRLADGNRDAAARAVKKLPAVLLYTVPHHELHVRFWESIGLSGGEFFRIVSVYPNVLSVSVERKLRPRVEFLRQCRLDAGEILGFLTKAPLFLSLSWRENLAKKLAFLVKIGYKHRTREMALAMGAMTRTSCENLQLVMSLFFGYGLNCEDVLAMSARHPPVLQYNHRSLKEKMDFLVNEMERDVRELLVFPAFLGYNLDGRIKLRYETRKREIGKDMSLIKLLSVSEDRFHKKKKKKSSAGEVGP